MSTPTINTVWYTPVSATGLPSYIQALVSGDKWGLARGTGVALTYSFPLGGASYATNYSNGGEWVQWAPAEANVQTNVAAALAAWANVANLTFSQVADTALVVGDLRIAYSTAVDTDGSAAWAYYPYLNPAAGDIWLAPSEFGGASADPGTYNYLTLIHEIGHALGLSHSFSGSLAGVTLPAATDNLSYTVMSYSTTTEQPNSWASHYGTTPMLYDIAAIQYLYGANTTYHTGDDVYTFDSQGEYWQTIWDAGGNDTIAVTGTNGCTIDLRAGEFSSIGVAIQNMGAPILDTVAIAFGTTIENASGGSGNDTLIGNDAVNILWGGAGDDILMSSGGCDTLDGGQGNDIYALGYYGVTVTEGVDSGMDTVQSFVSTSLARNFENLLLLDTGAVSGIGNKRDNVLMGNSANNILSGRGGDDILYGGIGSDTLSGGDGADLFCYDAAAEGGDRIVDFESGSDRVVFYSPNFGALAEGTLDSSSFVLNGTASQSLATFLFNTTTHALSFDADGNGAMAAVTVATFGRQVTLSANDILMVNTTS